MSDWEGVLAARGEHRTTGGRAWCHDDREWCYPDDYCRCCYHADDAMRPCSCCGGSGYVPKDATAQQAERMRDIGRLG